MGPLLLRRRERSTGPPGLGLRWASGDSEGRRIFDGEEGRCPDRAETGCTTFAGTLSRNPECDIDARGPTSCRRSRLRAHQESGNRYALTTAPAWTLTLDLSSVPPSYSRCRTTADITACLGDPVGNCGSPIGVHAGRCPCGGRNCGVDLSAENVDRPRPDQQRRPVLPAGVPSTSSTGHPRGACRDKA